MIDSHIPMSNGETIKVLIEPGEPGHGVWCDDCLLSTAVRFPLSMVTDAGVASVGSVTVCERCEKVETAA